MLKYATQVRGACGMMLLKPRGRLLRLLLGLHEGIDLLAEGRIGEHAPDLLPGDRLQDITRVMRQVPQYRIQLPPHLVGGMIP